MATVVYGGELELNLLTAGDPGRETLRYVREQADRIGDYIRRSGNDFGRRIVDSYDRFYSDRALHRGRAAVARVNSYFSRDIIRELRSVEEIQQAGSVMQHYVMSEPVIRRMYHEGRCNGYHGSYVDEQPGRIGRADRTWRQVMSGMAQIEGPSEQYPEGNFKIQIFADLSDADDEAPDQLKFHDKVAIRKVWDRARYAAQYSLLDPTSKDGDLL